MNTKKGFTVLEIIIVAIFASLLIILFFIQKSNLDAMERDEDRKTAINAMYYALEEGFYKQNKYYPEVINEEVIPYIDPALWSDPSGINIGDGASSYSYTPANCEKGKCKEYVLKAELEKEDAYIKNSRN
ncbi:type II secretion system protein [Candidatus Saccharibacteria bacterium]|nr:type II secretion system protein [Candidatus Saccharibacteria bacterium]